MLDKRKMTTSVLSCEARAHTRAADHVEGLIGDTPEEMEIDMVLLDSFIGWMPDQASSAYTGNDMLNSIVEQNRRTPKTTTLSLFFSTLPLLVQVFVRDGKGLGLEALARSFVKSILFL